MCRNAAVPLSPLEARNRSSARPPPAVTKVPAGAGGRVGGQRTDPQIVDGEPGTHLLSDGGEGPGGPSPGGLRLFEPGERIDLRYADPFQDPADAHRRQVNAEDPLDEALHTGARPYCASFAGRGVHGQGAEPWASLRLGGGPGVGLVRSAAEPPRR